jgi:hypothetical protein
MISRPSCFALLRSDVRFGWKAVRIGPWRTHIDQLRTSRARVIRFKKRGVCLRYAAFWLVIVFFGAPQAGANVGFCTASEGYPPSVNSFHTPLLVFPPGANHANALGDRFAAYMKATRPTKHNYSGNCWTEESFRRAKSHLEGLVASEGSGTWTASDFTVGLPLAAGGDTVDPVDHSSGLVIEKARPTPEEVAAERAKWTMEAVRAEALARAKTATLQAQSDAKYQADLAKLHEEMRKRGNAQ